MKDRACTRFRKLFALFTGPPVFCFSLVATPSVSHTPLRFFSKRGVRQNSLFCAGRAGVSVRLRVRVHVRVRVCVCAYAHVCVCGPWSPWLMAPLASLESMADGRLP